MLFLLLSASIALASVDQVHIGFGAAPGTMVAAWVTPYNATSKNLATVQWGLSSSNLAFSNNGTTTVFTDEGSAHRNITMHKAFLLNIAPNTRYYYRVGSSEDGFSNVFSFLSPPAAGGSLAQPLSFIVFGDMGVSGSYSLPYVTADVQSNEWSYGLDVGDFGYDMQDQDGTNGDQYFEQCEGFYALAPFLVCPGNHENAYNFLHYTFRFNNMPVNSGVLPKGAGAEVQGQPNNWYYSYDIGNTHFFVISTELYFYAQQASVIDDQINWLKNDLAAANQNRDKVPWIIGFGHRSLYCSCDSDCVYGGSLLREALEQIFYDNGVDLWINGHEHNFERLYATYDLKYVGGSGNNVNNPAATVYIVTGDAGNPEGHEAFQLPQPSYSAFRSNTFGYSRMKIYNDTHLYFEQVETDPGEPTKMGAVIDHMWLVQENHGAFATSGNQPQDIPQDLPHHSKLSVKTGLDGPGHKHKKPSTNNQ